jgi:hypothetical protein
VTYRRIGGVESFARPSVSGKSMPPISTAELRDFMTNVAMPRIISFGDGCRCEQYSKSDMLISGFTGLGSRHFMLHLVPRPWISDTCLERIDQQ